jgi:trimethylamine--corrinoid protein Co-methyltransferase
MRQHTTWLSGVEIELIVERAIGLLGKVGVRVEGSRRLPELEAAGAAVDAGTAVVRFPENVVRAAVAACPRSFVMGGTDREDDVALAPGAPSRFCSSGCAAFTLDHRTGERRPSTLADLHEATVILDELPQVDAIWTAVAANDLPQEGRELIEYGTVLLATHKHVTFVESPTDATVLGRLAEALCGDRERFFARPRFSTLFTVASPFGMEGRLLDVHAESAALGAPIEIYTLPMTGGTSPITLAGTITQCVAEFLGAVCAFQALQPGARLIFGAAPAVLDMRTSSLCYAAPEASLMGAACVEVAHALDVPVIAPGMATEAKHTGAQAGFEKAFKGLTVAAAGADLLSGGVGMLDSAALLSLPQMVVDAEIAAMIRRMLAEVEVSDETIQAEAMERIGIGGSFLAEKETRRRVRAGDFLQPLVGSRLSYEAWREAGKDELATATDWVENTLARRAAEPGPLDADMAARVRGVCGLP